MPVALTTICGADKGVSSWTTSSDMVGKGSGRSADMLEPEALVPGGGAASQGSFPLGPIGVQGGIGSSRYVTRGRGIAAGVLSGSSSAAVVVVFAVEDGNGKFSAIDESAFSIGCAGSASALCTALVWGSPPLPPHAHTSNINTESSNDAVCFVCLILIHTYQSDLVTRAGLVVRRCPPELKHRRQVAECFPLVRISCRQFGVEWFQWLRSL